MIKLKLLPPEDIKNKAIWFQKFRNECKAYLAKHGIDYDKFTIVEHDGYIGFISEWVLSQYIRDEFHDAIKECSPWEDKFDLKRIERIIEKNSMDEGDVAYVKEYFYDSWDLMVATKEVAYRCDIKTALTKKEPQLNWNFLYPIIQAEKSGKDLMILIYYIYEGDDFHNLTGEVLIGATTYDAIKKCPVLKKGDTSKFGTKSQADNYVTELSRDYSELSKFIH
ncbi:MAG: hypothetical protein WCW02_01485 [Candidatus Buchananbacteria bacterium]